VPPYDDAWAPPAGVGVNGPTDDLTAESSVVIFFFTELLSLFMHILDLLVTCIINVSLAIIFWLLEFANLGNRQRWPRVRRLGRRRTRGID
jgi:flagellar biosynthesis component FlhA